MRPMDDSASQVDEPGRAFEEAGPAARRSGGGGRRLFLGAALAILVAVTTWLFGHLPWVVSGFSWPTTEAAPVGSSSEGLAGVRLTIPLVAAFLPSLIAFSTIGAVAAALLPMVFTIRSGQRVPALGVAVASVLVTTVVITLMARRTITDTASDAFAGDSRVLLGLVLVVGATTLVGAATGAAACLQVGLLPLAAALAAGQVRPWVEGFLVGRGLSADTVRNAEHTSNALVLLVLTVAFALSVRRTLWWALLWPVAIALYWTAAPFRTATVYLAGQLRPSSGLPDTLPDILDGALEVFRVAYWEVPQAPWPWLVAVVLALAWHVIDRTRRRSRGRAGPTGAAAAAEPGPSEARR